MSNPDRSLVGSVFERTTPHTQHVPSSRFTGTPGRGFPTVQHRSRSAFARARDEANLKGDATGSKGADIPSVSSNKRPSVAPLGPYVDPKPIPTDTDSLLRRIHEENMGKVARMSEEEIDREKRAILEQLGDGTGELLRRVQEARRRKAAKEKEAQGQEELEERIAQEAGGADDTKHNHDDQHILVDVTSPTPRRASDGLGTKPGVLRVKSLENMGRTAPPPLPVTSRTRPSSRTGRKLRFAEITPDDVHVYESAPISPKRAVFALPPPPDTKDDSIVSLGTFRKGALSSERADSTNRDKDHSTCAAEAVEPEEGTPEYIRRRYFPKVPTNDPGLAWMEAPSIGTTDPSAPRFDLQGVPIPTFLSVSLPSHLGLHHHAEGSHAGYTIDDIFLLARSTVPAQRALMLGILAKIAHRLGRQVRHSCSADEIIVFAGQEGELRKRILAAGLAAIDQIGSLGARAVEVVWECLVEWDVSSELEGVELSPASDIVSSLQLDYLLPRITDVLSHAALPSESLEQLLAVLHWLAQQSNRVSDMITSTPRLVRTIFDTFLLTPIPPKDESALPDPLALQTLITLASASRSNASALVDPADALLRFATPLPPSSPYPLALATTLLTYTLRFYNTLASYGFYSQIVTTASQIFTDLASYVTGLPPSQESENSSGSASIQLRIAWASLVEVWTICATDPHATSPPHEIVWSQVCALGWATEVRKLRVELGNERSKGPLYAAIWDVEAAWLEGARINGIKGGEEEREEALQILRRTFSSNDGTELEIVQHALKAVQRNLEEWSPTERHVLKSLATACNVLASALRLWLACLPPLNNSAPLSEPPFPLPLSELSALSAVLVKHSVWSPPSKANVAHLHVHLRPLTRFMNQFHRVSRHIPGTAPQLWFAQALVFLPRLLPGDESYALAMLDTFLLATPRFVGTDPGEVFQGVRMEVLRPFFEYTVLPRGKIHVAPLRPNTKSILQSSTLRLPPASHSPGLPDNDDSGGSLVHGFEAGLPLTRDFLFTPLTHLLRSGTSPVFHAIPGHWAATEVDVVCATLLLAYAARRVLLVHGLEGFAHSAAETVFACMRVCMLEHGVGTSGTDTEAEVFRDARVERVMAWLLEPFTVRGCATGSHLMPYSCTLEDAAAPYLEATPFYQFYTDLVALYGAVSFGHQMFAALVVTPLAMQYAVDYRRALWCGGDSAGPGSGSGGAAGLGDVVRSVRVSIEDVVCTCEGGDPREYLYPIERDVAVLGAYVAALVTRDGGGVEGFLRLVAVHHIACTLWDDLDVDMESGKDKTTATETHVEAEAEVKRREEIRVRLLRAVLVRGETVVVQDVVLYRQRQRAVGPFVWPPTCYRGGEDQAAAVSGFGWREQRVAFVRGAMGDDAAKRVATLLISSTIAS